MLLDGRHLFPLRLVIFSLDGYYMSKDGAVFSTNGSTGVLRQLNGSRTSSGHYYTLKTNTYRHDQLFAKAKAHAQFLTHTSGITREDVQMQRAVAQTAEAIRDLHLGDIPAGVRAHAPSVHDGITRKGVLLGTVDGDILVFGSKPKLHLTEASWRDEAERIAKLKPGLKVVAFKIIGSVVAKGVHWE